MDLNERIAAIKKRLNAATVRPWRVTGTGADGDAIIGTLSRGEGWNLAKACRLIYYNTEINPEHNAQLIAHAPDDLTEMVKTVEAMRDALLAWRAWCDVPGFDDGEALNKACTLTEAVLGEELEWEGGER